MLVHHTRARRCGADDDCDAFEQYDKIGEKSLKTKSLNENTKQNLSLFIELDGDGHRRFIRHSFCCASLRDPQRIDAHYAFGG